MNRRRWIGVAVVAGVLPACRKEPASANEETTWVPLDDAWEHTMGGELTRPVPGMLRLGWGETLTAATWKGSPPVLPFEFEGEARRIDGTDFFCGLTFPARDSGECLTWVVGGWGGALVGLSSIDGKDAAENETKVNRPFEKERWYSLRLRCGGERIEAWIDGERVIDFDTTGRKLGLRPGPVAICAPFGLATWQTTGEFKGLRWRAL